MTRWRVLTAASIWLVLCLLLWITDARPAVAALAGIVAVGTALVLSVIDVVRDIDDTGWPKVHHTSRSREDDRWVRQLRSQMTGARQTDSNALRERLLTVINAQLSAPHGVDRSEQALSADHRLTPVLREVRTGSYRRLGSQRTLDHIITDIEAL